jgi:hypothetical protein
MDHPMRLAIIFLALAFVLNMARAADLSIELPREMKPASANATAEEAELSSNGQVNGQRVSFTKLLASTAYSVKITLADGKILEGVDMNWYTPEPAKKNVGPITDDDRKEIQAIMDVPSFYNRSDILLIKGDHDRAVILGRLIRDKEFHSDKGGEIIWRIELWYFKNEYGGWAKLNQVNRILHRERFKNQAEYDRETGRYQWVQMLGGIVLDKDHPTQIKLTAAATQSVTTMP